MKTLQKRCSCWRTKVRKALLPSWIHIQACPFNTPAGSSQLSTARHLHSQDVRPSEVSLLCHSIKRKKRCRWEDAVNTEKLVDKLRCGESLSLGTASTHDATQRATNNVSGNVQATWPTSSMQHNARCHDRDDTTTISHVAGCVCCAETEAFPTMERCRSSPLLWLPGIACALASSTQQMSLSFNLYVSWFH